MLQNFSLWRIFFEILRYVQPGPMIWDVLSAWIINRWKWKLLCTLTMSLTLSTTSAHLAASECSFKAFSFLIQQTLKDGGDLRHLETQTWDKAEKNTYILHSVCWSPGTSLKNTSAGVRLDSMSGVALLQCWQDGRVHQLWMLGMMVSSARWWPRASPHVHIARAAWPSGTCAPLWKWGGLEEPVCRADRKKEALLNTVRRMKECLIACVSVEEPEAGSPWGNGGLSSYPPTDAAGSVTSV